MEFVLIPAGEFVMGSNLPPDQLAEMFPQWRPRDFEGESPQHRVRITKPFYLGKYEVTQGQWQEVTGTPHPWWSGGTGRRHAAYHLYWNDCQRFVQRLGSIAALRCFSLPTEAQWEYACRAGSTTLFSFGNDSSKLGQYAWYSANADKIGQKYAHEVGLKKPNPWGLYGMHGNVSESCSDWYRRDYYTKSEVQDPTGPSSGSGRLRSTRGGTWFLGPAWARSAGRQWLHPEDYRQTVPTHNGLRVCVLTGVHLGNRPQAPVPAQAELSPSGATWTNPIDGSEMVLVPAGTFSMGEGENATEAHVPAFRVSKFEVTNNQWKMFLDANPGWRRDRVSMRQVRDVRGYLADWDGTSPPAGKGDHPVGVSWHAAKAYCEWAGGRLPSKAEWEKACRAGLDGKFCFGDDERRLGQYAWFKGNSGGVTHTVGQKQPNRWGIYDMHGYVIEWCYDGSGERSKELRGGGCHNSAAECRAAYVNGHDPSYSSPSYGFRLCLSPDTAGPQGKPQPGEQADLEAQEPDEQDEVDPELLARAKKWFAYAQKYEASSAFKKEDKIRIWRNYLTGYRDSGYRLKEARERLEHWQGGAVPTETKRPSWRRGLKRGHWTPSGKTCVNPIDGSTMVYVPAGEFKTKRLGHFLAVVNTSAFYISKYEVTNKQWKKFRSRMVKRA